VLRERRTTEGDKRYEIAPDQVAMINERVSYRLLVPAWPNCADPDVIGSPEAGDWLIELEKANEKRRIAAEQQAKKALRARVAEHMQTEHLQREAKQEVKLQDNERLMLEGLRRQLDLLDRMVKEEKARRCAHS